jgi:hypothetical protein
MIERCLQTRYRLKCDACGRPAAVPFATTQERAIDQAEGLDDFGHFERSFLWHNLRVGDLCRHCFERWEREQWARAKRQFPELASFDAAPRS